MFFVIRIFGNEKFALEIFKKTENLFSGTISKGNVFLNLHRKKGFIMKMKFTAGFMALAVLFGGILTPVDALADRIDDKPYLSLGADLTEEQKAVVLDLWV